MELQPKEIVKLLDEYVIGQNDAKKVIAVALRNRYRRLKLTESQREDITPKNILMIGSTGVGKTEIARRLSKLFGLPFVKVEASKYTEVGYVGRDVESMVRDLARTALAMVKKEAQEQNQTRIEEFVEEKLLEILVPNLPAGASEEKLAALEASREKMREKLKNGALDNATVELEVSEARSESELDLSPELDEMRENLANIIISAGKKVKKKFKVKDARKVLENEAVSTLLDDGEIKSEALMRTENEGIIFIDEIDKVVALSGDKGSEPSKNGVQRDLLPIVEGCTVKTKIGQVKTDHILFIAAGAFHVSKPSDLIPELQGRFPLRVSLDPLDEKRLFEILTKPKNSLLRQYELLLGTENVRLVWEDDAVSELARLTAQANETVEDIGARRLHTVLEKVLEDVSFAAEEFAGREYVVTAEMVRQKLENVAQDRDLAKYIL